ncbi:MAG: hypothetical protein V8Q84_10010 [Bilophila sp.]
MFGTVACAIDIVQDRITRSRMAGDPPDIILTPRLGHIGLLEFYKATEAIREGRACVERMLPRHRASPRLRGPGRRRLLPVAPRLRGGSAVACCTGRSVESAATATSTLPSPVAGAH